jgi:hypothetical protein
MDLRDHLDLIAGTQASPSVAQADADLARGRHALRRRRAALGTGAAAFVAAAAAAVVVASSSPGAPAKAPAALPSTNGSVARAKLVSYVGKQPAGYTIDEVPSGWAVQGDDDYVLTIAPNGITDKDPHSFVGKIIITLQSSDDHATPQGTKVDVGGLSGVINEPDSPDDSGSPRPAPSGVDSRYWGGRDGKNLWVHQKNGDWLQVQMWDASGWSNAQITEFGAGIHVLASAKKPVG